MASTSRSVLLEQLSWLAEKHPVAPKQIFVPYEQLGSSLYAAMGRYAGGCAGLHVGTLPNYARQVAEIDITSSGREGLSSAGRQLLVASVLQSVSGEEPGSRAHLVPTIARSVETLRQAGLSVEEVREELGGEGGGPESGPQGLLPEVYEAYLSRQEENKLFDEADVYRWATSRIQESPPRGLSSTVIGIAEEVELTGLSLRFFEGLVSKASKTVLLGSGAEGAPEATAGALLSDELSYVSGTEDGLVSEEGSSPLGGLVPSRQVTPRDKAASRPPGDRSAGESDPSHQPEVSSADVTFKAAVGARGEVRSVFRTLLKEGVPLDEVAIAYTRSTPYLGLLVDTAEEMGVPLTMSPGLPVATTRPGQALRGFYEWIREDFDVAVLVRLLRSGLLQVESWLERKETDLELGAEDVARILAGRQYEPGREGYEKALSAAIEELEKKISKMKERGSDPERQRTEWEELRLTRSWVQDLIDLVPRRATASELAKKSSEFLGRFFRQYHAPGEETSRDDAALKVLQDSFLEDRKEFPFTHRDSTRRLVTLFEEDLGQVYVGAAQPEPGAVHVLPLDGAGYEGRSHLFVVGLDNETASQGAVRRRLLSEAERESLRNVTDLKLPEPTGEADSMWFFRQALRRHQSSLTLVAMKYDLEEEEARFPSSLYLQQAQRSLSESEDVAEAPLENLAEETEYLRPNGLDVALDAEDEWLAACSAREANGKQTEGGETGVREAIEREFPWIPKGFEAEQKRASGQYTEYDGLLPKGKYPELDILGPDQQAPSSAHRLEALAEAPYAYFLKYVLGARPLEEPALDDEPWLNNRRRGSILHDTFEAFMKDIDRVPREEDEERLIEILSGRIDRETRRIAPGSAFVEQSARQTLQSDARLFLAAEVEREDGGEPCAHEFGFGYGPWHPRYEESDEETGVMNLQDGQSLQARGRIDRIDRHPDGSFSIWDYKTGSTSRFDVGDPLQNGETLQWALYAAVYGELKGEEVREAGYFFTSTREMGHRLGFRPAAYRGDLEDNLQRLSSLARSGSFPMRPKADDTKLWKWDDFSAVEPDLDARTDELDKKEYSPDRPRPHFL
jgi:RecB family exonuclease